MASYASHAPSIRAHHVLQGLICCIMGHGTSKDTNMCIGRSLIDETAPGRHKCVTRIAGGSRLRCRSVLCGGGRSFSHHVMGQAQSLSSSATHICVNKSGEGGGLFVESGGVTKSFQMVGVILCGVRHCSVYMYSYACACVYDCALALLNHRTACGFPHSVWDGETRIYRG